MGPIQVELQNRTLEESFRVDAIINGDYGGIPSPFQRRVNMDASREQPFAPRPPVKEAT